MQVSATAARDASRSELQTIFQYKPVKGRRYRDEIRHRSQQQKTGGCARRKEPRRRREAKKFSSSAITNIKQGNKAFLPPSPAWISGEGAPMPGEDPTVREANFHGIQQKAILTGTRPLEQKRWSGQLPLNPATDFVFLSAVGLRSHHAPLSDAFDNPAVIDL